MARLSSHIETYNTNRSMVRRIDDLSIGSDRSNDSVRSTISVTTKKLFQNAMDNLKSEISSSSSSLSSSRSNKRRNESRYQRRRRRRKSVSFPADPTMMIEVHHTLSINEYSASEREACWFVKSDYERIVEKCRNLIRKSTNWDNQNRNTKLCLRGLERMTRHGFESTQRIRNIAYDKVLRLPQNEIMQNPEVVAQLYGDISVRSVKKALRVAEEDAGSAMRYHRRDCM